MQIGTQIFTPSSSALINYYLNHTTSRTQAFSRRPFNLKPFSVPKSKRSWDDPLMDGVFRKSWHSWKMCNRTAIFAAAEDQNLSTDTVKKRKVVEHVCLLKAKEDLSEEQEKDMLDYLYTTQYQMRGIVAISLGRVSNQNTENYTHAIYMRFQRKEAVAKFYDDPFYIGVLRDHVMPYCHGLINVDYESEVQDDILAIFRKGEEFNYGVELILLIEFVKNSLRGAAEDALAALEKLTTESPSLIVQATKGSNINLSNTEYTHGVVIRFRSSEAFEMFMNSSEYKNIWSSKFQPIIQKALYAPFSVDPVGTELM